MNLAESPPLAQVKKWLNIKEAAEYTGLSTDTLYMLVYRNGVPFHRPGGLKVIRFDRDELDVWMKATPTAGQAE